jgi:hypothetical protein
MDKFKSATLMLQYSVDLPSNPKYLLFSPKRVNNQIYEWLLDNVGCGSEFEKLPEITQQRMMWQAIEVKLNTGIFRTIIRIFFRNEEDAVHFKMVWL